MADSKISALTAATALTGTEEYPVNQGGTSKKATARQNAAFARLSPLRPTGSIAETFPRDNGAVNVASFLATARLHLRAIWLPTSTVITSITFMSGTTAASSPTNQWFGLFNSSREALAFTSNDTTAAWPASTTKTLNLTSSVTTTYDGLYYLGIMVQASTPPTLMGTTVNAAVGMVAPATNGTADTAMSTPPALPFTAAALNSNANNPWAWVS